MPNQEVGVPTGADQEVIYNESWEHQGVVYAPGDPIRISGERGNFRFYSHGRNTRLNTEWVDVYHEGHHYRSFRPNRVVAPVKKSKGTKQQGQAQSPVPVCDEHKSYTAQRKPRTDCARCWQAYEERKKG